MAYSLEKPVKPVKPNSINKEHDNYNPQHFFMRSNQKAMNFMISPVKVFHKKSKDHIKCLTDA